MRQGVPSVLRRPTFHVTMLAAVSLIAEMSVAADWPQFLGPNRNGISTEEGLLQTWPNDGPKELWRQAAGVGMSGIAISDGKLATLAEIGGQQTLVVHDAQSGKRLQAVALAPAYRNAMGNGPRATPAIVDETAYAYTGEGILAAVSIGNGNVLWKRNLIAELGGKPADYGMASSPLVVGNNVVVTLGLSGATVVSCDRKSGKTVWKSGDDACGYSSAALLKVGNSTQLVAHTGSAALGIDPKTGKPLWRFPFTTDYDCNIATPISWKGNVFISSGENHGSALLELKPKGGTFGVAPVWTSFGSKSVLRNEWQTSVLIDGKLYGFDNVGSAGPVTHLTCVDIAKGERVWQKLRFGKGNLIAADGKLFMTTMKGDLVVAKVNPDAYEELGRVRLIGMTRQAPALSNGLLYVRDDKHIVCVDVRKP